MPAADEWPIPGDASVHIGTRHHLVPRFYLDRFARDERIGIVDRHTRAYRVGLTRDTATERDFYTFINLDGEMDGKLEQLLGKIEGDAAQAIRNITSIYSPTPTDEDHIAICLLIAFQLSRGRKSRRDVEQLADLSARLNLHGLSTETAIRARVTASRGVEPTADEVAAVLATYNDLENLEFVPDPNEHIGQIGTLAEATMPHLLSRPWYLVHFDSHVLLASDEPVVLSSPSAQDEDRGIGVSTAEEIWFPLDPRRVLILGPIDTPGRMTRMRGQIEFAQRSNWLVAQNAYNEVFLHPDHDIPIPDLPPAGPLFRVTEDALPVLARYNQPLTRRRTARRRNPKRN